MSELSEQFFDSGAMACQLFYRMNGLHGAITCLHGVVRAYLPVVRINAMFISKDFSTIIHMFDTSHSTSMDTRSRKPGQPPAFFACEKLSEPLIVNNVDPFKTQPPFCDPELADIPMLQHHSVLRLPLFENEQYFFILNFWSDEYEVYRPENLTQLERLTRPLAEELRESLSFTVNSPVLAAPVTSGYERLSICPELSTLRELVKQVAPTNSTVLVLGETGVGKECVVDALHELSTRKKGPLIKVNCGALTPTLLNSELFGHEKGSFTGAVATRRGLFEQAGGGTLFLDEIGEMPLDAQVHLLRALENRSVVRVGDHRAIPVDVRVIAATHNDLAHKVREGTFRKDLWFRLAVFPLTVPPLRTRKADIPTLMRYFLRTKARQLGMPPPTSVEQVELDRLYVYDWPGNVRELEYVAERSLIMGRSKALGAPFHFEFGQILENPRIENEWPSLAEHEQRYIRAVLEKTKGKLTGPASATEILDIHYTTLRAHMRDMGIAPPRQKREVR